MEKIASFTIDHIKLEPGVYVSRKDTVGSEVITTFDLRMTSPNDEPVMNTAEVHTRIKRSISDRWDAAPDFICCSQAITHPKIS